MFAMLGGEAYSRRIASIVVSVRNRMRPPLGHCARLQTSLRNSDFDRVGRRISSPSFSLNHGNPLISSPSLVGESQRNFAVAEVLPADSRLGGPFVACAAAVRTNIAPAKQENAKRKRAWSVLFIAFAGLRPLAFMSPPGFPAET